MAKDLGWTLGRDRTIVHVQKLDRGANGEVYKVSFHFTKSLLSLDAENGIRRGAIRLITILLIAVLCPETRPTL